MPGLDRFILAFHRDLDRASPHGLDHYARLYWDDRGGFYQAQDAAWDSGRAEPYISLGEVRSLNEVLSPKTARRLAHRYLAVCRFGEGAEVIRDARYGLMRDGPALLQLARLELGLGRASQAAEACARALDADPGLQAEAAPLAQACAQIAAAEAAADSGDWALARRLFDLWIEAGSEQAGLRVLTGFLSRGRPLGREDLHDFHHALDLVLSLCKPRSTYNLFRALLAQPVYRRHHRALETLCAMLGAAPGEAPPPPGLNEMGPALAGSAAMALARSGQAETAITILGELSFVHHKAHYLRMPLARVIGQEFLRAHPLRYGPPGGRRRIFDVVMFNNELRILNVKLHEMADFVDAFIVIEARQTYSGAPKPLVFQENREQFARFADKIVHVVVEDFPPHLQHAWAREYYQRNHAVFGLNGRVREDDLVMISDADEIVSREAAEGFEGDYAVMGMERLRFFLNYRQTMPPTRLKEYASIWRGRFFRTMGVGYLRDAIRFDKRSRRVQGAGWHFTSVFDAPGIAVKLNASSHQEHAGKPPELIDETLTRLRAGDYEPGWERWDFDDRFPAYLRAHREDFEDFIL